MGRFLLLNKNRYPGDFQSAEYGILHLHGSQQVEKAIIDSLNERNPKWKIEGCKYVLDRNNFSLALNSSYIGLIATESVVKEEEVPKPKPFDYVVLPGNDDDVTMYTPLAYVFLSPTKEEGRNVLFTQSVFPALIDIIEQGLNGPSYTVSNHPLVSVNLVNKEITAASLIKRLNSFQACGIEVVEPFYKTIDEEVCCSLESFAKSYDTDFVVGEVKETPDYRVDFRNKSLKIKTEHLVPGDYLTEDSDGNHQVHGSSEKFYWVEVVPLIMMAIDQNYEIDFNDYKAFIEREIAIFSGEKFRRMKVLLSFLEKVERAREGCYV